MLAGALLSAGTGVASAIQQRRQGSLQLENARRNAEITRNQNRADAIATSENLKRRRRENTRHLSLVKARLQESGLVTTSGSTADFLEDASSRLELGILDEAQAQNFRDRGARQTADAQIYQGRLAEQQANLSSVSTLVGSGVKLASQHSQIQQQAPGGNALPSLSRFDRNAGFRFF